MPTAPLPLKCEPLEPEEIFDSRAVRSARDDRDDHDDSETHQLSTIVCGYRIGTLVGRGGMSVVFQVTHPRVEGPLAMKVIIDARLQDDVAADAIYAHARTVATLKSRHVVKTIDAGRLPSGEPFVVMERLDGEDLAVHLDKRGPLPIDDALRFAIQACDGLAEAHGAGIVHGDIKPGNLVIDKDELGEMSLKVIDFAPSVPRAADPDDPFVTCSPGYAAPEQLGSRADVDARADVWGLGAVIYELVTGRRAFNASSLSEMLQVTEQPPPPMRKVRANVPPELEELVLRCLAREREHRFADVLLLRDALSAIVDGAAERARIAQRAAETVRAIPRSMLPPLGAATETQRPRRALSRRGRYVFLAALGPISTLLSMTLVRLLLASSLVETAHASPNHIAAPSAMTAPAGGAGMVSARSTATANAPGSSREARR